jgi:hypothetical protein
MNRITRLSGLLLVAAACGARDDDLAVLWEKEDAQFDRDDGGGDAEALTAEGGSGLPGCPSSPDGYLYAGYALTGSNEPITAWGQIMDTSTWCTPTFQLFSEVIIQCRWGLVSSNAVDPPMTIEYIFDLNSTRLVGAVVFSDTIGMMCTVGQVPPTTEEDICRDVPAFSAVNLQGPADCDASTFAQNVAAAEANQRDR